MFPNAQGNNWVGVPEPGFHRHSFAPSPPPSYFRSYQQLPVQHPYRTEEAVNFRQYGNNTYNFVNPGTYSVTMTMTHNYQFQSQNTGGWGANASTSGFQQQPQQNPNERRVVHFDISPPSLGQSKTNGSPRPGPSSGNMARTSSARASAGSSPGRALSSNSGSSQGSVFWDDYGSWESEDFDLQFPHWCPSTSTFRISS